MRNEVLMSLALTTVLHLGCDPEAVDASRADADLDSVSAAHAPADILVLLDVSESMTRRQMEDARSLVVYLVSVLDEHDRFALVAIRKRASVTVQPDYASPEAKGEWARLIGVLDAEGLTNLEAALELAGELASPETRVLLITDGSPTWGSVVREELAEKAGALDLWTVGVGRHDQTLLHALGRYVDGSDPAALAVALLTLDRPDGS